MKDYFKIGDVFDLPVKPSHVHDESGYGFKLMLLHSIQSEYAAHAINSHDELVEMNKELLAALDGMMSITCDSCGVVGYHLNGDIAEWDEFEEVAAAHDAIVKAKGGAV